MNRITINGHVFEIEGNCGPVSISNGCITIGGMTVQSGLSGIVEVKWEGELVSLKCDSSVKCNNVAGDVSAGGSVDCGDVIGNVSAGGSVKCGTVGGSVNAGGSIKMSK
jgi:hypothetical protein